MKNVPVARRYARALLDVAGDDFEPIADQLAIFARFFEARPELFALINLPTLARDERVKLVDTLIAQSEGVRPVLAHFLRLLAQRHRFALLSSIADALVTLIDARRNQVRGTVRSARPLDAAMLTAVTERLEAAVGKRVLLETRVDPALLGGVVATVGTLRFDGSIRGQLDALAAQLEA